MPTGGTSVWDGGFSWRLQAQRRGDATAWLEIRRSLEDNRYLRDGPTLLERHDPEGMAWSWLNNDPSNLSLIHI